MLYFPYMVYEESKRPPIYWLLLCCLPLVVLSYFTMLHGPLSGYILAASVAIPLILWFIVPGKYVLRITGDRVIVMWGIVSTEKYMFDRIISIERHFASNVTIAPLKIRNDFTSHWNMIFNSSFLLLKLSDGQTVLIGTSDPIESLNALSKALDAYRIKHRK